MPSEGVAAQKWGVRDVGFGWRESGGRSGGVGAGPEPITMDLTLGEMSLEAGAAWWGFKAWCRGARRTFTAYDLLRPYPAAYPAGFGGLVRADLSPFPADGAPTGWSVDTPGQVLSLEGLPAGFQVAVGDWFGWVWDTDRRTAARAVEAATANVSGQLSVTIEPPLPDLVPALAAMVLAHCAMVFRLTPETDLGSEDTISLGGGRIVAEQDLRE